VKPNEKIFPTIREVVQRREAINVAWSTFNASILKAYDIKKKKNIFK